MLNGRFSPKLFSIIGSGISTKDLYKDILSGTIVGIVALPLAIAFAIASGLSPEKGLITAIIAGFIISFFGGSRFQIGGPTGAFVVIVFGITEKFGYNGLVISTILGGVFLICFGLLNLGSLLKFIPHPLIIGFTSGIALIIFTTQVKDALGLEISKLPAGFAEKWKLYIGSAKNLNINSLLITLSTIFIILFSSKLIKKIPGSLLAIIIITVITNVLKLDVSTIGSVFGEISRKITFGLPVFEKADLINYLIPAFTIALLGGMESLLSAVVADGMTGDKHRSNTELIAQGIANIASPLFGGIPATGAIARTATNIKNGGKTPFSGLVHAIVLLFIMIFASKWAAYIPMACLSGILIVVAYNMSEWQSFADILKGSVFDKVILLTTFFLTVLVDLTVAIEIGVVLSALLFMKRMADIDHVIPGETVTDVLEKYPGLSDEIAVYEINGPFFFASATQYSETMKQTGMCSKALIIRMRHVPFIDSTGIRNLKSAIKGLQKQGTKIYLSGVNPKVMKDLNKNRIVFMIGKKNIFNKFEDALLYANNNLRKT